MAPTGQNENSRSNIRPVSVVVPESFLQKNLREPLVLDRYRHKLGLHARVSKALPY